MSLISAQVSLYPLGQDDLAPAIDALLAALGDHGLEYEVGSMSTVVWGDDAVVWEALRDGFRRASALGGAVLNLTISNACPLPQTEPKGSSDGRDPA